MYKINKNVKIIILLLILDVITTWFLLTNITEAMELNGLLRFLMSYFGVFMTLIITHIFAIILLLISDIRIYNKNDIQELKTYNIILKGITIFYLIIGALNTLQVIIFLLGYFSK